MTDVFIDPMTQPFSKTRPGASARSSSAKSAGMKALGSSFYWALRLMPRARREAMFCVYAFCRDVDDVADGPDSTAAKRDQLQSWRADVEGLFGGDFAAEQPAERVLGLKAVVDQYGLQKSDLIAVIDGMQTDACDVVRMADEAALDLYMDQVASAVGRLSDKVFGISGEDADRLAHHLGRALQITNILRDLQEDADRNRLYVPLDMLQAHGLSADLSPTAAHAVLAHPKLAVVAGELAGQAHGHFDQARVALAHLDSAKTRPARIMLAVYFRLLEKLQARGWARGWGRVGGAVRIGKLEKLWLAVRHGVGGRWWR